MAASALTTDGIESLAKDTDTVSAPETRPENTDNSGIRCASSPEKAAFTEGILVPRAAIGIAAIANEKSALDAKRPITDAMSILLWIKKAPRSAHFPHSATVPGNAPTNQCGKMPRASIRLDRNSTHAQCRVGLSDTARDLRIGWRLTPAVTVDPGFEVHLDATRREAANDNAPPEHGVML